MVNQLAGCLLFWHWIDLVGYLPLTNIHGLTLTTLYNPIILYQLKIALRKSTVSRCIFPMEYNYLFLAIFLFCCCPVLVYLPFHFFWCDFWCEKLSVFHFFSDFLWHGFFVVFHPKANVRTDSMKSKARWCRWSWEMQFSASEVNLEWLQEAFVAVNLCTSPENEHDNEELESYGVNESCWVGMSSRCRNIETAEIFIAGL